MVDRDIIENIRHYMQALESSGLPVCFTVLVGSYARGDQKEWSDIDLVVVSPRFDAAPCRADINLLWRVAARTDSRIEPIPCGERQWAEDTSSALIEVARQEGQRIQSAA